MPPARTTRLDRAAWVSAAVEVMAEGGPRAIAVEPLAIRLGTTKGSFYWHFRDRDELVTAALERWEHDSTTRLIRLAAARRSPAERLRELFDLVFSRASGGRLELALLADVDDPVVGRVLARVTRRRLEYLTELFEALDVPTEEARQRALLAYSANAGLLVAHRAMGSRLFSSAHDRQRYLDGLERALLPLPAE